MHIADGVLSGPVLAAGVVGAAGGIVIGVRRLREEDVPKAALLASAFFVASLLQVRVGGFSVHLVLNGLLGIFLGWMAFPAIFLGLLMQLVFFGHGGVTTLGVNVVIMALPAVLAGGLWRRMAASGLSSWWAGLCGGGAVALSALLVALALWASSRGFLVAAQAALLYHLPIMGVEGVVTVFAVRFMQQVQPNWRGEAMPELNGR